MFRRILVAGWVFIFGSVALMGFFPKLATRTPRPDILFIFPVYVRSHFSCVRSLLALPRRHEARQE